MDNKLMGKILMTCYPQLEGVYKSLNNCVRECVRAGFYSNANAIDEYDRISGYIDRKQGIVNLKVLAEKCMSRVPLRLRNLLVMRYLEGISYGEIMRRTNTKERTLFYRMDSAYEMLMQGAIEEGYSIERIEEEYESEPFFQSVKTKVAEKW